MQTTVILKKYKKDMLLHNFNFDKMDLMNYKNKERNMNAKVMTADKATQTLNKETKATQTDLPNDKATQTYNFDDMTKLLGGSSKSFKSKLTKAEAEALAFTYDPDLYDDDDDDGDKKDDDIDKYRKKIFFMLMRIIEFMLRTGFSIGQIVAHLIYTNVSEEVELNTSPPISVNSSPPITVHSSSTHTVNSSSSSEESN